MSDQLAGEWYARALGLPPIVDASHATSALMTRFYSNLWEKKLPPLEAMRHAQLSIMDDPNFGDGGNPQLWAAWTLSGDPGGLRMLDPPTHPRAEVKK